MIKNLNFSKLVKTGIFFTLLALSLVSCKKNENLLLKEQQLLDRYILEKNITDTATASGLYYIKTLEGEGEMPTAGRDVTVNYTGMFLDGRIFDEGTMTFGLWTGSVIEGMHEGVSYMKVGGKARLIIPSPLGYYASGKKDEEENVIIPGYTTLIFDVELINAQ